MSLIHAFWTVSRIYYQLLAKNRSWTECRVRSAGGRDGQPHHGCETPSRRRRRPDPSPPVRRPAVDGHDGVQRVRQAHFAPSGSREVIPAASPRDRYASAVGGRSRRSLPGHATRRLPLATLAGARLRPLEGYRLAKRLREKWAGANSNRGYGHPKAEGYQATPPARSYEVAVRRFNRCGMAQRRGRARASSEPLSLGVEEGGQEDEATPAQSHRR